MRYLKINRPASMIASGLQTSKSAVCQSSTIAQTVKVHPFANSKSNLLDNKSRNHARFRISSSSGDGDQYPRSRMIDTIQLACETKSVPPEQVSETLSSIETLNTTSSQIQGEFPRSINGTHRLVFATPAPIESWAYIPVIENAIIDVENKTIKLESFVGPVSFTFSGTCSFRDDKEQPKMDFSFNALSVGIFGNSWSWDREAKPKTYSFFLITPKVAAVRSTGSGGTTLMLRM